jgi:two-component system chemotaxis response regulator CheY
MPFRRTLVAEAARRLCVLVADDDPAMRTIVRCAIQATLGVDCVEAKDGEEALAILRQDTVDLVICDWVMPHVDGLGVLKAMKGKWGLRRIPFIMVTAEATGDDVERASLAGASDYVVKPFEIFDLVARAGRLLRGK